MGTVEYIYKRISGYIYMMYVVCLLGTPKLFIGKVWKICYFKANRNCFVLLQPLYETPMLGDHQFQD